MNTIRYIEVAPAVKLQVTDYGTGKPVVMIHGWPLSNEIFKYQYQDLIDNGYRAIGITLRGFGRSDRSDERYDISTFSSDIEAIFIALSIENAILIGHSLGAIVAAKYIAAYSSYRVDKLVLLSANVPLSAQLNDQDYSFLKNQYDGIITGVKKSRLTTLNVCGPTFLLDTDFLPQSVGNWLNKIMNEAAVDAIVQSMISIRDLDLSTDLHKIDIPTAIFHGVNDQVIPINIVEEAYIGIKNTTLVKFEEGGHWIFLKERERFLSELLKFIQMENNHVQNALFAEMIISIQ